MTEELTPREKEVVALLGKGYTDKQICKELDIARQTVRSHIANIMDKLDLTNRTQIALHHHGDHHGIAQEPAP
jgi:DNA-binding NarL/FixJ family response regulator